MMPAGHAACAMSSEQNAVSSDVILLRGKRLAYLCAEAVLRHSTASPDGPNVQPGLQVLVDTVRLLLGEFAVSPAVIALDIMPLMCPCLYDSISLS